MVLAAMLGSAYFLGGPMPRAGTEAADLIAFINANSKTQEWSWFLASGPALLIGPWFLGVLTAHLWGANPEARPMIAAGFSTALTAAALFGAASVTWGLFVYLGTQVADPALLLVLAESRHFAEGSIGFPIAGTVIAFSLAGKAHLPAWRPIASLGVLAACLQLANGIDDFVGDGVTGLLGPVSFGALLAWLAATSLALTAESLQLPLGRWAALPHDLNGGIKMHRKFLAFLIAVGASIVSAASGFAAGQPVEPMYANDSTVFMSAPQDEATTGAVRNDQDLYVIAYPALPTNGQHPLCNGSCPDPSTVPPVHDTVLSGSQGFGNDGTAGVFNPHWHVLALVYTPAWVTSPDFQPARSAAELDSGEAMGHFVAIAPGAVNPFERDTLRNFLCVLVSSHA
jgi:hypothetical protein